MVLLVLGKQLHRACCRGGFNMPIRQGDDKMALLTRPAKPFCACMAYKRGHAVSWMTGQLRGLTDGGLDS
jgi:hypothetical protein